MGIGQENGNRCISSANSRNTVFMIIQSIFIIQIALNKAKFNLLTKNIQLKYLKPQQ